MALGPGGIVEAARPDLIYADMSSIAPAVAHAIRGGLAGSAVLEAKAPMMLAHQFKPGFRISLHIKDLRNAIDASEDVGVSLPLTATVLDMLRALEAQDHGAEDHSGIVQYYESLSETRLEASE